MIFFDFLKKSDYASVLRQFLPTRYYSDHVSFNNRIFRGNNTYLFFLSICVLTSYFLKQLILTLLSKKSKISESYSLMVYLPNHKYERFFNNLFQGEEKNILIISDEKINLESITKNNFTNWLSYLTEVFIPSFKFSFKVIQENIFKLKCNEIDFHSILHLGASILQSFFLINIRNNTNFRKILSLHPNGDLHFLFRMVFNLEIHSIRPDTTSFSKEHHFINTDYLYFKSLNEKKIYESFKLKTKLIRAGYIYDKIEKPKQNFNKTLKILFIDTCTNKNIKSLEIRNKALNDFYDFFSSDSINKVKIYHKFHPGLLPKEKKKTEKKIKINGVQIINQLVNIKEYDLVIGFYSTLFHDVLCNGVCFIELSGQYNMYPQIKNSIHESPILKINSRDDMKKISSKFYFSPKKLYSDEIWKWYYSNYNIPSGKLKLIKILS